MKFPLPSFSSRRLDRFADLSCTHHIDIYIHIIVEITSDDGMTGALACGRSWQLLGDETLSTAYQQEVALLIVK